MQSLCPMSPFLCSFGKPLVREAKSSPDEDILINIIFPFKRAINSHGKVTSSSLLSDLRREDCSRTCWVFVVNDGTVECWSPTCLSSSQRTKFTASTFRLCNKDSPGCQSWTTYIQAKSINLSDRNRYEAFHRRAIIWEKGLARMPTTTTYQRYRSHFATSQQEQYWCHFGFGQAGAHLLKGI